MYVKKVDRDEEPYLGEHRKTKREIFEENITEVKNATTRNNVDIAISLVAWVSDKIKLAEQADKFKNDAKKASQEKKAEIKKAKEEKRRPDFKNINIPKPLKVSRGEVWQCQLGENIGSEQNESRPVLIIQNEVANKVSPNTIIAPLTSLSNRSSNKGTTLTEAEIAEEQAKLRAGEVLILPHHHEDTETSGIAVPSVLMCQNIREINKYRLEYRITKIDPHTIKDVDQAIKNSLGLE